MTEYPTVEGHWDIHYQYSVGATAAAFFAALRDDATILGSRCDQCERVLVPARSFCERCFVRTDELVLVGTRGRVTTFTRPATPIAARSDTFSTVGLILLDGASSAIPHFIGEVDDLEIEALFARVLDGLHVEAQFRPPDERTGSILDIAYFKPVNA
jgi:hypothetical protein